MTLLRLLLGVPYTVHKSGAPMCGGIKINTVTAHIEDAAPDALFVCLRTPLADGHNDALAAYSRGCRTFLAQRGPALPPDATVIVVDDTAALYPELAARLAAHPERCLTVFGVAGKLGKTTVIRMAEHILEHAGIATASFSQTAVCMRGVYRPHGLIAPDAGDLVRFFAEAAHNEIEFVFLECSAYLLAQKVFSATPFAAVLLTDEPAAFDGDDAPTRALFAGNAPFAFLPAGQDMPANGRVFTFGDGGDFAAFHVLSHALRGMAGQRFLLSFGERRVPVSLSLPGEDAVVDAVAAAALATAAGVPLPEIAAALGSAHPRGTLCALTRGLPFAVYADSAFDAPRLARALRTLRAITPGRLLAVIGSVGGRARERRAPLGEAAYTNADFVYFTADDPDDEAPMAICRDMISALEEDTRSVVLPDRADAIRTAVSALRAGDVLLIAGKGEDGRQLIHGAFEPFDEARLVKDACAPVRNSRKKG